MSETEKIRLISFLLIQHYTVTESLTVQRYRRRVYKSRVLNETLEWDHYYVHSNQVNLELLHQTSLCSDVLVFCLLPDALLIWEKE